MPYPRLQLRTKRVALDCCLSFSGPSPWSISRLVPLVLQESIPSTNRGAPYQHHLLKHPSSSLLASCRSVVVHIVFLLSTSRSHQRVLRKSWSCWAVGGVVVKEPCARWALPPPLPGKSCHSFVRVALAEAVLVASALAGGGVHTTTLLSPSSSTTSFGVSAYW